MERTIQYVGGFPTHILRRAATSTPRLWLVIIPGNPGLVDFYDEFVNHLYELHGGAHTVVAVGHVGHGNGSAPICSLEEQIEHKASFLEMASISAELPSFVLIGHSVGAYISLQVVKRYPNLRVQKYLSSVLTNGAAIQDLNAGLKPVVRWLMLPVFRHVLGFIAHWAPSWLKMRLLQVYEANMRPEDKARARALMCYTAVNNILYMAHTEAQTITRLDESLLAPVQDRLVFLFAKHDRYTTPLEHFCYPLRERFPRAQVHVAEDPNIPHAFVQGYSEPVARLVHSFIVGGPSTTTTPSSQ